MKKTTDKLQMIIAMAIFGTIGIVRRYIPYPSSVIALVRGSIGAIFLLLVMICRRDKFSKEAIKKNGWLLLGSGALIGFNWICLFEAYRYTTVSVATMCYYMAPVFVILVSPFLLHEKMTVRKAVCSLIAVFGMVLVSGVLETEVLGLKGILFGLVAAVMYAMVVCMNKFIKDLSAIERTLFQLSAAAIAILPYTLVTENVMQLEASTFVFLMLAVAGIVHTGISYFLYFASMRNLPAQTVALFSYIDPIVAVILSMVILKEDMTLVSIIGVVLVIGAMLVSELSFDSSKEE